MEARLAVHLRVEGRPEQTAALDRDDSAIRQAREHVDIRTDRLDDGARMNVARTGGAPNAGTSSPVSNESTCDPKALRRTRIARPPKDS